MGGGGGGERPCGAESGSVVAAQVVLGEVGWRVADVGELRDFVFAASFEEPRDDDAGAADVRDGVGAVDFDLVAGGFGVGVPNEVGGGVRDGVGVKPCDFGEGVVEGGRGDDGGVTAGLCSVGAAGAEVVCGVGLESTYSTEQKSGKKQHFPAQLLTAIQKSERNAAWKTEQLSARNQRLPML